MPLIINRHGGTRLPNRRIPVVPPFPQPGPQDQNQEQSRAPEAEAEAEAETETEASGSGAAEEGEFEPGPRDVSDVRLILEKAGNLPPEVADIIIDYAEYWVCSTSIVDYRSLQGGHLKINGGRRGEDRFLLRTEPIGLSHWSPASQDLWRKESTPRLSDATAAAAEGAEFEYPKATLEALAEEPLPDLEHPVQKVVFDIVSRDQGWSSEPKGRTPYENSHTWFDAGLERFDRTITCPKDCPDRQDPDFEMHNIPTCAIRPLWPLSEASNDSPNPNNNTQSPAPAPAPAPARYRHELHPAPDHCIQRNKHADKTISHHHVEWRAGDAEARGALADAGRGEATGDGAFVRNLKLGDIVTVWGRARYGGWVNRVERVEVRVFWAV